MTNKLRVLTFSTLYPNAIRRQHGVFVETRLRYLVASGQVESTVLAPTPWFPSSHPMFGEYAKHANVPAHEIRHGLEVFHPSYVVLPKVGMSIAPTLLYLSSRLALKKLLAEGRRFDVIDSHYFYPDGVSAVLLGREFGIPVSITGRGADLTQIPDYGIPRRQILWAAKHAACMITVCKSLKDSLVDLGAEAGKIHVLRNGVDLEQFKLVDRIAARAELGLSGPTIVSVGALIPRKGHDLTIQAMTKLRHATLLIVGEGRELANLKALVDRLGLVQRVRFVGQQPHDKLTMYYNAADISVLASSSEGWANVLLESMACGTPVAATDVSGTPEVVTAPEAGLLISQPTPECIADTIIRLFSNLPLRAETRAHAEKFSWDATTDGQLQLFRSMMTEARNS